MAARTYSRDSRGRFASGGGGGGRKAGGAKGAASRKANAARAAELQAKGTTGLGARLKAKGFTGGKGAQQRAGGLRASGKRELQGAGKSQGRMSGRVKRDPGALQRRNAQRAVRAQSKAAQRGKQMARTSKAPESAAKSRFKELSTKARRGNRYGGNFPDEARAGGAAKRSLAAMVKNRGVSGSKSKGRKRG